MKALTIRRHSIPLLLLALAGFPSALQARTLIEPGSGAGLDTPGSHEEKAVTARFRREFDATNLKPDERLVILVNASDGEVVTLNGREMGRSNMPMGPVDEKTLALAIPDDHTKGLFVRFRVPPDAVRAGAKNVILVEVHSANAAGSRLSCEVALKTLPPEQPLPAPPGEAKAVLEGFRATSYIGPGTPIPDGYFDGGHRMVLDAEDHATSSREILLVDRAHDMELTKDLAFAKSLRELPQLERVRKLSLYVDKELTPPGGMPVVGATMEELEHEFKNKPLKIGDVCDQYHAGVCRHRSLLFKVLADEAGLKTALVRGFYVHIHSGGKGAHAWNEVLLDNGRRVLVDTTLHPKSDFPDVSNPAVTSAEVSKRYVKLDGSPYYGSAAR